MNKNYTVLANKTAQLRQELADLKSTEKDLQFELYRISSSKSYQIWLRFLKLKWIAISIVKMMVRGRLWPKLRHFWFLFFHDYTLFKLKTGLYQADFYQLQFSQVAQSSQPTLLPPVEIVIPWYGDPTIFELLPTLAAEDPLLLHSVTIIDDAHPDKKMKKALTTLVQSLSKTSPIGFTVRHNRQNQGFVKTSNKGLASTKLDVVLMNSDVRPIGSWLKELLTVANSQPKIGTVTPLSNNATIFSIPQMCVANSDPEPTQTADLLRRISPVTSLEVPTGHGFCLFINRECLKRFGAFDKAAFGRGYCEENDLSQRYLAQGYVNLVAAKSYVMHLEGQSFSTEERLTSIEKNYSRLVSRYPHYSRDVHSFMLADPLQDTRKALAFFQTNSHLMSESAILIVLHQNPFRVIGGVERETLSMLKHLRQQHPEKLILLYYFEDDSKQLKLLLLQRDRIIKVISFAPTSQPTEILYWILETFSVRLAILEHLQSHDLQYVSILKSKKIRQVVFIHDFYFFCQVPDLINAQGAFCYYEKDTQVCDTCLAAQLAHFTPQATWRRQAQTALMLADHVVFNSEFTKKRFLKLFSLKSSKRYLISFPELNQILTNHAK